MPGPAAGKREFILALEPLMPEDCRGKLSSIANTLADGNRSRLKRIILEELLSVVE
jgi:hypothetical protein